MSMRLMRSTRNRRGRFRPRGGGGTLRGSCWPDGHFLGMVLRNTDEDAPRLAPRELALHLTSESTTRTLTPKKDLADATTRPRARGKGPVRLRAPCRGPFTPGGDQRCYTKNSSKRRTSTSERPHRARASRLHDVYGAPARPFPEKLATNRCGASLTSPFATSKGSTWRRGCLFFTRTRRRRASSKSRSRSAGSLPARVSSKVSILTARPGRWPALCPPPSAHEVFV